jgi:hypothetical protein
MVLRVWASTGFHPASPGPAIAPAIGSTTGLSGDMRNSSLDDMKKGPLFDTER